MEFATGVIVRVSLPLAALEKPMPNVYILPLMDILVGVALERLPVPPLIAKAKSLACKAPLPPLVLYTLSENVTATVALPTEMFRPKIDNTDTTGLTHAFNTVGKFAEDHQFIHGASGSD